MLKVMPRPVNKMNHISVVTLNVLAKTTTTPGDLTWTDSGGKRTRQLPGASVHLNRSSDKPSDAVITEYCIPSDLTWQSTASLQLKMLAAIMCFINRKLGMSYIFQKFNTQLTHFIRNTILVVVTLFIRNTILVVVCTWHGFPALWHFGIPLAG